jgi:hypothetical protein
VSLLYLPSFMKFCSVVLEELCLCSCAYYQEILIAWILWELCPFELRNFPKFTIEAACQHNSSETSIAPTKCRRSTFPGNMHNYICCPYYLPSFMKFCSVVAEELCWQTLNRISWNLVGSKDTICSCAYYQEMLIAWNLWELCPFELIGNSIPLTHIYT